MKRRALLLLVPLALSAAKEVSDDALYDLVRRKLASDPIVKGGALEVQVKNGNITVSGKVETHKQKERAEKLVKKMKGVKSVTNQLQVTRP